MRENSFVFCSRLCFDTLIIIIKRMNIILPSSHLLHLVLHSTEREVWGHLGNKRGRDLCQSQAPSLTVFSVGCLCGDGTLIGPEEPALAPLSCLRPAPSPLPEIWPDTCFRVRSFNLFQPQDKKLKCWLFSIFILISPHWFWTKLWNPKPNPNRALSPRPHATNMLCSGSFSAEWTVLWPIRPR